MAASNIYTACRAGDAGAVQHMLEEAGPAASALALAADAHGTLPLHLAAFDGHAAVVGLLLKVAPAAASVAAASGFLPLHLAALKGHQAVVRLLLEAAPTAARAAAANGSLPLHAAARHGHAAVVGLLLEAEPDTGAWGPASKVRSGD